MQTVAITGANGYVGSRVAAALEDAGFRVIALVREPQTGSSDRYYAMDADIPEDLLSDVDILVHCAWDMRVSAWDEVKRINIDGSFRLIDAAVQANTEKIIFVSSMSAYTGCKSRYGQAKLAVETYLQTRPGGLTIRPGLIYGEESGGMVGALAAMAKISPVLPMIGLGKFKLHTCHERDLTELITYCCGSKLSFDQAPAQIVTAAESAGREFRDIVRCVAKRKLLFIPVPWRLAWFGLRALESLGIRTRLKSDSLIGLVNSDPSPDFTTLERLPVNFRPLKA